MAGTSLRRCSYQYLPLNSATCTRLIEIARQPGPRQLPLIHLGTGDSPRETAAAETDEEKQTCWFVNHSPQDDLRHGARIPITANLQDFLDEFHRRSLEDVRYLWIDALCINQDNLTERRDQIALMGRIYSSCERTIAWLGVEDADSLACTKTFAKLGSLPEDQLECLTGKQISHKLGLVDADWFSFARFMNRNWWHRKWTLQETVLPKHIVFWCGRDEFCRSNMLRAIRKADTRLWQGVKVPDDPLRRRTAVPQRVLDSWFVWPYVLWSLMRQPEVRARIDSVAPAYARLRSSSDARDSVYSIISFLGDSSKGKISIDYEKTAAEVFTEYVRAANLDLFLYDIGGRACRRTPGLPSWVPDYSVPQQPLEWINIGGNVIYHAGGEDVEATAKHIVLPCWNPRILAVPGILVDTIKQVGGRAGDASTGKCFADALAVLDLMPWTEQDEDIVEAFWRTLLSNMTRGRHPDSETFGPSFSAVLTFYLAKWIFISKSESNVSKNIKKSIVSLSEKSNLDLLPSWKQLLDLAARFAARSDAEAPILSEDEMERLSPYLEFIREKFDERCFFITEHGRMGIGPDGLKAGTLVCVVKGCKYPFLLDEGTAGRYKLLGPSYVRGIMFGEALQTQEFERVEIE
ncbi:heterokaryon incompatibility protein 6, OR allele [Colletotrichum liriopes]|uniref:Heterokaryon incompatibility protein 6, OR allele n=1 Tax=Colletotrichum liriopes TaxID=708192 RepID=A0AA37LYS8_9PEZI|nr:heterokaryon incompatibility protein 6, OR allele [Colletotrichum liriopes]